MVIFHSYVKLPEGTYVIYHVIYVATYTVQLCLHPELLILLATKFMKHHHWIKGNILNQLEFIKTRAAWLALNRVQGLVDCGWTSKDVPFISVGL